jgi:sugar phosphate permease
MAFFVAGVPGLLLALLSLTIFDAPRGAQEPEQAPATKRTLLETYGGLLRNRTYVLTVLGYSAYTFALGGLAFWTPAFLERARGVPRADATIQFGAIIVVTGFVGTFAGGWIGDHFFKRTKQAHLWVCGLATLLASPFVFVAITSTSRPLYLCALVVAEILLFAATSPIASAVAHVIAPTERATAVALLFATIHLLGDVPSPPLIGAISDASTLERALLIVPAAFLLGGLIWLTAAWEAGRRETTADAKG